MGLTRPRAHQLQDSDFKQSVRAISTSNVTLSGGAPSTVDGVSLALNDRVLVTGQSTGSENGIYYVTTVGSGSNGTWARSPDADTTGDMTAGMVVMVTEGTSYADTSWKITTDDPITLGSTSISFAQASAHAFGTISVSGQDNLAADGVGDTLTVAAGNNIVLTTTAASDTLTVAANDTPSFSTVTATGNITGGNITTAGTGTFGTMTDGTVSFTSGNISGVNELRIDQTGTGLRMTNVGAFDNDGSDNFRIFSTNDLTISANGQNGTALTVDATNQDVTIENDLRVDAGNLYVGGTAVTATAAELNLLDGVTGTLVTEAGTQTLTNKSISASQINSGTLANAQISSGSVVQHQGDLSITESQISDLGSYITASSTDTLTNKSISASQINSGTLANAQISSGSVVQHQGDLTITESQISDLGSYITASSTDTLTNKTLTSPNINEAVALTSTATELNLLDGVTGITLGTANELLVVGTDGTSIASDSTLSVDTGNNRLGINQTSPEVTLHMTGESSQSAQIRMEQHDNSGDAPDIRTRKSRGTAASPSKNNAGDYIFRGNFERYDGSAYTTVGQLAVDTNGSNADRFQLTLTVSDDGGTIDAADAQFKIDGNASGAITFNNAYTFPTADGTANQVLQTDGSGALSFATVNTTAIDNVVEDTTPQLGGDLDLNSSDITGTGDINTTGTITASGNITGGNLLTSGTVTMDRLSLSSSQTTVPPLQLTANSLQDGVGALRIDGSQADIFLNPSTATHTTVTFAVNNDQRLAFGMDNNSDFYITRRTGNVWYDDTFVIDRDTGELRYGYDVSVTGNLTYGTLNDGTTALTSTVAELNILDGVTATTTELNYVDGVTSAIQTQLDAKAPTASPTFTGSATGVNLTLSGNLTVNGTTTTVASTNTVISDNLIELNNGASSNANDSGIVIERGSTGDNAFMGWDESADSFILGTTTATGSSTGDLTISAAPLSISSLTLGGTAVSATATELNLLDGVTGTLVTEAGTQTLTNKSISASQINSGTLANAQISSGSVVQHQGDLTITESQISDLGSYITELSDDTTPQLGGVLDTNGNNIEFPDSSGAEVNRLRFGTGDDLEIYHDGTDSFITDRGAGSLRIRGYGTRLEGGTNSPFLIHSADGYPTGQYGVKMYHITYGSSSERLKTTSSGSEFTGTIKVTWLSKTKAR